MRKWKIPEVKIVIAAVIVACVLITIWQCLKAKPQPLKAMVTELGIPNILAKRVEFEHEKVRLLRVVVPPVDPKSVIDWSEVTNCVVIWISSETGQENAGFFYDEMKNDKAFDGGGWYSARNIFGEKLIIAYVDSKGMATNRESYKTDAISFKLDGFVPSKPKE
jgi:hypothetical protein